eukprot:TRINITY_DN6103_c0_g1_i1.p1 TRINITY_DN6103_c0_g1~~TRINITY_DN6103_c0_g1_i1.p1  ORF type:complete len:164 (+),score=24.60 TRINITY_DN6103_c0_g1_i1:290-781(+)
MPKLLKLENTCNQGHILTIDETEAEEEMEWLCDGSADPGGCVGFGKSYVKRWRCDVCNFDLCECCLDRRKEDTWGSDDDDTQPDSETEISNDSSLVIYEPHDTVSTAIRLFDSCTLKDKSTPPASHLTPPTSSLAPSTSLHTPPPEIIHDNIRNVSKLRAVFS